MSFVDICRIPVVLKSRSNPFDEPALSFISWGIVACSMSGAVSVHSPP